MAYRINDGSNNFNYPKDFGSYPITEHTEALVLFPEEKINGSTVVENLKKSRIITTGTTEIDKFKFRKTNSGIDITTDQESKDEFESFMVQQRLSDINNMQKTMKQPHTGYGNEHIIHLNTHPRKDVRIQNSSVPSSYMKILAGNERICENSIPTEEQLNEMFRLIHGHPNATILVTGVSSSIPVFLLYLRGDITNNQLIVEINKPDSHTNPLTICALINYYNKAIRHPDKQPLDQLPRTPEIIYSHQNVALKQEAEQAHNKYVENYYTMLQQYNSTKRQIEEQKSFIEIPRVSNEEKLERLARDSNEPPLIDSSAITKIKGKVERKGHTCYIVAFILQAFNDEELLLQLWEGKILPGCTENVRIIVCGQIRRFFLSVLVDGFENNIKNAWDNLLTTIIDVLKIDIYEFDSIHEFAKQMLQSSPVLIRTIDDSQETHNNWYNGISYISKKYIDTFLSEMKNLGRKSCVIHVHENTHFVNLVLVGEKWCIYDNSSAKLIQFTQEMYEEEYLLQEDKTNYYLIVYMKAASPTIRSQNIIQQQEEKNNNPHVSLFTERVSQSEATLSKTAQYYQDLLDLWKQNQASTWTVNKDQFMGYLSSPSVDFSSLIVCLPTGYLIEISFYEKCWYFVDYSAQEDFQYYICNPENFDFYFPSNQDIYFIKINSIPQEKLTVNEQIAESSPPQIGCSTDDSIKLDSVNKPSVNELSQIDTPSEKISKMTYNSQLPTNYSQVFIITLFGTTYTFAIQDGTTGDEICEFCMRECNSGGHLTIILRNRSNETVVINSFDLSKAAEIKITRKQYHYSKWSMIVKLSESKEQDNSNLSSNNIVQQEEKEDRTSVVVTGTQEIIVQTPAQNNTPELNEELRRIVSSARNELPTEVNNHQGSSSTSLCAVDDGQKISGQIGASFAISPSDEQYNSNLSSNNIVQQEAKETLNSTSVVINESLKEQPHTIPVKVTIGFKGPQEITMQIPEKKQNYYLITQYLEEVLGCKLQNTVKILLKSYEERIINGKTHKTQKTILWVVGHESFQTSEIASIEEVGIKEDKVQEKRDSFQKKLTDTYGVVFKY